MRIAIENADRGKSAIGFAAATAMIASGAAVVTVRINGQITMIRMVGGERRLRDQQDRGYDEVKRSFHREAARLPLINPDKMIREEKSDREFSFSAGVERERARVPMPRLRPGRSDHDYVDVAERFQRGRIAC